MASISNTGTPRARARAAAPPAAKPRRTGSIDFATLNQDKGLALQATALDPFALNTLLPEGHAAVAGRLGHFEDLERRALRQAGQPGRGL